MKRYLRNLLFALLGKNPYWLELHNAEKKLQIMTGNEILNYQNLTENLRRRVVEKDADLHKQAETFRKEFYKVRNCINERDAKIAGLREDLEDTLKRLQKSNHTIAYITGALNDFCDAMQAGDSEKLLATAEDIKMWCAPLYNIAQQHIMVLQRVAASEKTPY